MCVCGEFEPKNQDFKISGDPLICVDFPQKKGKKRKRKKRKRKKKKGILSSPPPSLVATDKPFNAIKLQAIVVIIAIFCNVWKLTQSFMIVYLNITRGACTIDCRR